jgi:glutamyl-tRNA synthetase
MNIDDKKIEAYALENAVKHKGKAQSGSVLASLFAEGLKKEEVKDIMPIINKIISKVNSMQEGEQKEQYEILKEKIGTHKREVREEGTLPQLPEAEKGKVVMRFAPFPSGPLHIGNTRQAILNDEYVKMYNGKLILVIDDTIGSEEKPIEPEAYKMIPESLDWLGINYDKKIVYKSDRLETYYAYAEELIKKGYMYVCDCPSEKMRENREKGIDCGCRHLPEEEHIERWKKMFKPETKEGSFAVRLKTSMQHENPAFRDRVMFRISERTHPKIKNKYKVWPLLEFSWAIDDHLLGITHIVRGIDLMMETKVEEFIWNIFKWSHPVTLHTGFLRIEGVKISKSKGAKEVKSGTYIGWNDPRLWSLQSLKDRGIKPEAIREFILSVGMSKANIAIAVDVLYALNRKYLEKSSRYFFIQDPVKIHIKACPELEAKLPLHPNEDKGFRVYQTNQDFYIPKQDYENLINGNYRLMHLLNFKTDKLSPTVERDFSFLSVEPDQNLKVKFIQWLPAFQKELKVNIRMPDNEIISGLGESELENLEEGDTIQFERFGFVSLYKLDKKNRTAEFWFSHK